MSSSSQARFATQKLLIQMFSPKLLHNLFEKVNADKLQLTKPQSIQISTKSTADFTAQVNFSTRQEPIAGILTHFLNQLS